jgi:hypothetical protein
MSGGRILAKCVSRRKAISNPHICDVCCNITVMALQCSIADADRLGQARCVGLDKVSPDLESAKLLTEALASHASLIVNVCSC